MTRTIPRDLLDRLIAKIIYCPKKKIVSVQRDVQNFLSLYFNRSSSFNIDEMRKYESSIDIDDSREYYFFLDEFTSYSLFQKIEEVESSNKKKIRSLYDRIKDLEERVDNIEDIEDIEGVTDIGINAGGSYDIKTSQELKLSGTVISGEITNDHEWFWTFDDSSITLEGKNPSYTFKIPDTYTGTLYIYDGKGSWGKDTFQVNVTGTSTNGGNNNNNEPGFELIIVIAAVAITLMIFRKKKNKHL